MESSSDCVYNRAAMVWYREFVQLTQAARGTRMNPVRGLSLGEIYDMRERLKVGATTDTLAQEFCCCVGIVRAIATRKSWL